MSSDSKGNIDDISFYDEDNNDKIIAIMRIAIMIMTIVITLTTLITFIIMMTMKI